MKASLDGEERGKDGGSGRERAERVGGEGAHMSFSGPSIHSHSNSFTNCRPPQALPVSPYQRGIRQRACIGGGEEKEDEPEEKERVYLRSPAAGQRHEECLYFFAGEKDSERDK